MSKATLCFFPGTCAQVTAAGLEETGTDYEMRLIDLRSPEAVQAYRTINPNAKVPALIIDGAVLFENAAILWFLNERSPGVLFPRTDGAVERQRQLADLIWCSSAVHPMVRQVRMPQLWTAGDPAEVAADGRAKLAVLCGKIGTRVGADGWWDPSGWTMVDTYLWWCLRNAERGGFDLGAYPDLQAYLARIEQRPSIAAVLERQARFDIALVPTTLHRKPSTSADLIAPAAA